MAPKTLALFFSLLLAGAAGCAPDAAGDDQAVAPRVVGRTLLNGKPAPGVIVRAYQDCVLAAKGQSDQRGVFSLRLNVPGWFALQAERLYSNGRLTSRPMSVLARGGVTLLPVVSLHRDDR